MQNNDLDNEYISSFLAGAQITDSEIVKRFDTGIEKEESSVFFKRVFKTPMGATQTAVPATYYVGFCIPKDTSEKAVINAILKEIEIEDLDKANAVYLTLRNLYPYE
jgi:hypothetical protein